MQPFRTPAANLIFETASFHTQEKKEIILTRKEADKAFIFAAKNGLVPWIFHQINNNETKGVHWPQSIKQSMRMQYLQTLVMNQQKWKVFREIKALAATKGIPVIPLKGTALAFSYILKRRYVQWAIWIFWFNHIRSIP